MQNLKNPISKNAANGTIKSPAVNVRPNKSPATAHATTPAIEVKTTENKRPRKDAIVMVKMRSRLAGAHG